jgi:hypothetical protein
MPEPLIGSFRYTLRTRSVIKARRGTRLRVSEGRCVSRLRVGLLWLACWGALVGQAAAEQAFPYTAYVTADDVFVRSGPGENYYPTDKLKAGTPVEVYRHDPGGWYAIRPPKDSFSWVSSRHVQLQGNGLAVVSDDRVASRVGSRLSDVRDIIQVRLHKGETVEVFGGKGEHTGGESAAWYKIAPPSGEFRWVSGRFVDPDYKIDGVRRTSVSGRRADRWQGSRDEPGATGPFSKQLDQIDLELSAMIVDEPAYWDLNDLKRRAEALFNQAATASQQGHARMLISKINRFEDIKRRKQALSAGRPNDALPDAASTPRLLPLESDGRFDAAGQLIRVPNPKPGGPQYAILDSTGNMRCYVSPAPGVNLRSYVGRQIGVTGIRGYIPDERASHIMARHVSVVEGTQLK